MKLDVNALRYLSKDEFRVLTAVEMGMKNHEIVPTELVERIAGLKHGGASKNVKTLLRHKLVHHDSSKYDGYRLTTLGYDFLAIKTMVNRGLITGVGRQIGVGKESDIFEVVAEDGQAYALKLHRLGRTSFRAVKSKRDYLKHRNSFNWLYLSRLAALKEYAFMKALGEHGFPVPKAVDWNRHCVLMTLVPGYPLVQVKKLQNSSLVFETIMRLIVQLAEHGLIHCDFNEFNILIDDKETVTMIDFPQMVSVSHRNAEMYFNRDVECIFKFFNKRFSYSPSVDEVEGDFETLGNLPLDSFGRPSFKAVANASGSLDKELAASGFTHQDQEHLEQYAGRDLDEDAADDEAGSSDAANSSEEDVNAVALELQESAISHHINGKDEKSSGTEEEEEEEEEEEDDGASQASLGTDIGTAKGSVLPLKGLAKQRKRAVAAVRSGSRSHYTRNASKDKGGRRSRHGFASHKLDF